MQRILGLSLASLVACLAIGCSEPTGTVSGTICVDGDPLGGFEVTFIHQESGAWFIGYAKGDGRYEVFGGKGNPNIPAGEYKVTVAPTGFVSGVPHPKVKFPDTYTDPEKTELTKTVAGGDNEIDFDLKATK